MSSEDQYWKCDYENLRRKKNREIELLQTRTSEFVNRTYSIFESMGLTMKQMIELYGENDEQGQIQE